MLPKVMEYCEAVYRARERTFVSMWKWNHPQRISTQQRVAPPTQRVPPVSHVKPTPDKER